jgi:hypothetical protein
MLARSISFYGSQFFMLVALFRIWKSVKNTTTVFWVFIWEAFDLRAFELWALNFLLHPSILKSSNRVISQLTRERSRAQLRILNFSSSPTFEGILFQMDEMNSKLHECDVILGTMSRSSAKDKLIITQETLRRNNALMTGMTLKSYLSCSVWSQIWPDSHIYDTDIKQPGQASSQHSVSVYSLNSNLSNVRILFPFNVKQILSSYSVLLIWCLYSPF